MMTSERFTDPFCIYEFETWSHLTRYQAGCRCRECKDAVRDYWRRRKAKQRMREAAEAAELSMTHGTISKWNSGCRCDRCKAAYKRMKRREKK